MRGRWTERCLTAGESEQFCASMATGLRAGAAARVLSALAALPENRRRAALFTDMAGRVNSGAPLSEALEAHSRSFPPFVVRLVREAEARENLPACFERLRHYFNLSRQVHVAPWVESAFHPLLLLLATYLVVMFILTRIVPVFAGIFEGFGGGLPAPTRLIVDLSGLACRCGMGSPLHAALVLLVFAGLTLWLRRSMPGSYFFDSVKIRLPIVGRRPYKASIARFSQALSALLDGGVSLTEGLSFAVDASGCAAFRNVACMARRRIEEGDSLPQSLRTTGFFDSTYCHLLAAAERTKGLAQALAVVATVYAPEATGWRGGVPTTGSLLLLGMLLFFLGFTIISLYLPMFTLGDAIIG